MYFIPMIH